MTFFVDFNLHRASELMDGTFRKAPAMSAFWVFHLKIRDPNGAIFFEIDLASLDWDDLEFQLVGKDREISSKLVAAFGRKQTGVFGSGEPTLFDEYSNQYFSILMSVLGKLPTY